MPITKQQQRSLPANQARVEVRAMDGTPLASTTPQKARKLVQNQAAKFQPATGGGRYLQMCVPSGSVVPPRLAASGEVVPTSA